MDRAIRGGEAGGEANRQAHARFHRQHRSLQRLSAVHEFGRTQPELVEFAATNLICTRVLYSKGDSKEESWKKSRIVESFNIPNSHAVIIANADGKRIGELSTAPQSIAEFIADIKTIIAKSVPEGRLKYCEVGMIDKTFVPDKTYKSAPPKLSSEPLKGRYINFMTAVRVPGTTAYREARPSGKDRVFEPSASAPFFVLKFAKNASNATVACAFACAVQHRNVYAVDAEAIRRSERVRRTSAIPNEATAGVRQRCPTAH